MKQTIAILTALMLALLLVSGFIVVGSTEQSQLLIQREDQLRSLSAALDEETRRAESFEKEAQRNAQQLRQTTQERDALSQQLTDVVLASQEANDAVAQRQADVKRLEEALREAGMETLRLQAELEQCQIDLNQERKEASAAALAYEQQAQEDAAALAALQTALENEPTPSKSPSPTPSPSPSPSPTPTPSSTPSPSPAPTPSFTSKPSPSPAPSSGVRPTPPRR